VIGAEALVRWRHPIRGLLKPKDFIATAEESGLIEPIGRWVLSAAAERLHQWQGSGADLLIAVNLSARQLGRETFLKSVHTVIDTTGCDPRLLEFEITESMLMNDSAHARNCLEALNEMGISLAIDDFGTGYSNLAYLRDYPIRCLKIDRSFIASRNNWPLVEAILGMSHFLNVRTVAEGVEEIEQLDWLRDQGCDEYQGYYFSPPVPANDLISEIRALEQHSHMQQARIESIGA
jgi:EAL domain-containing protein (putative c-di-GMP-specific phosphodiesterase class I)